MSAREPRVRRHTPRISNLGAAAIALAVVLAACYLVFGGSVPFTGSPFVLRAVFTANTDLHIPSPVRIAGVQVGEVTGVQRIKGSPNAGIVVMQIDKNGLPIHADATADIRSRIFLEGNFYVDLQPGTPESPILASGATLPAANTSGPVQLDRVLSALDTNARANLQKLVQGLGDALNSPPTAAQQAGQDPATAGMTGAQALNYSL
ncbi:MAG TPA: MlaD family protein, partial [Solirubrobacteraceae bacterium]|nr:MlaD family protein [Solirubrobacteraceae bacterium]